MKKMKNFMLLAVIITAFACSNATTSGPDAVGQDNAVARDTNGPKQDVHTNQDTKQVDDNGVDSGVDTGSEVCTPNCWYKECGDNGCGGSCGQCKTGYQCQENKCVKSECDLTTFKVVKSGAEWKNPGGSGNDKGFFTYYEVSSEHYPVSQLIFRIRQASPFAGPTSPGTFQIGGNNIDSDSLQVIGLENCPAPNKDCAHYYYGAEGTVEIKQLNGANGPFEAVFHNAKMKEISFTNTGMQFVNNGRTWCLDGHEIKATSVESLPKDQCVSQGTGTGLYDNIGDFTLTNCLGDQISLHSLCGKYKVMWITVAAKWCPHCKENVPIFWDYYTKHKTDVNFWVYLAEGQYQKSPTKQDCLDFANNVVHIDPAHVFIGDNQWSVIFAHFNPLANQIGYPFSFIMDGKNMSYLWSSGIGANPMTEIDSLLK